MITINRTRNIKTTVSVSEQVNIPHDEWEDLLEANDDDFDAAYKAAAEEQGFSIHSTSILEDADQEEIDCTVSIDQ